MSEELEFKNNKGTDNHVGVADNIGLEMLKQQKANHEQELKTLEDARAEAIKTRDNYKEQWDIHAAKVQVQLDNWGMIEEKKTHKFHLVPEYWELEKKLFQYQFRMDKFTNEAQINAFDADVKSYEKQLDGVKKNLEEINKRIMEAEQ